MGDSRGGTRSKTTGEVLAQANDDVLLNQTKARRTSSSSPTTHPTFYPPSTPIFPRFPTSCRCARVASGDGSRYQAQRKGMHENWTPPCNEQTTPPLQSRCPTDPLLALPGAYVGLTHLCQCTATAWESNIYPSPGPAASRTPDPVTTDPYPLEVITPPPHGARVRVHPLSLFLFYHRHSHDSQSRLLRGPRHIQGSSSGHSSDSPETPCPVGPSAALARTRGPCKSVGIRLGSSDRVGCQGWPLSAG
eukprot:572139-Hanusia_phi.AAC.4